jgi:hypothetical protein
VAQFIENFVSGVYLVNLVVNILAYSCYISLLLLFAFAFGFDFRLPANPFDSGQFEVIRNNALLGGQLLEL